MSKFRLWATTLLVALCTGFYSCGGDESEVVSNEGGNSIITGTTVKIDMKQAGSLSTLISDDVKYKITDLTITGDINGDDIRFIREMAGADVNGDETEGCLSKLNLKDANTIASGNAYYASKGFSYHSKKNIISSYMFTGCNNLTAIIFPESTTIIEESIFSSYDRSVCNPNLTSIVIGSKVTTIQHGAFASTGISTITIPDNVTSIEGSVFNGCTKLKNITISNNITELSDYIFSGCIELTNITIPNNIISIGTGVFSGCTKLKNIIIPDNVISIGGSAFDKCTGLEVVTIGSGVQFLGSKFQEIDDTFRKCNSLKEFIVSASNPYYTTIDGVLFTKDKTILLAYPDSKSTSYIVPDGVTQIGSIYDDSSTHIYSFTPFNNSSIMSITLPNSIKSINNGFIFCSNLKEVHMQSEMPPLLSYNQRFQFQGINSNCILFVPKGTLDIYRDSDMWRRVHFKDKVEE